MPVPWRCTFAVPRIGWLVLGSSARSAAPRRSTPRWASPQYFDISADMWLRLRSPTLLSPPHGRQIPRASSPLLPRINTKHVRLTGRPSMTQADKGRHASSATLSRRHFVHALGACAGTLAIGTGAAHAQAPAGPAAPPSTVTTPPRDFSPRGAPNTYFWDPDVIAVDPSFDGLAQPNAPIQRLWTGALWSEGPAWNAQGRYLVWSDIPNNRQLDGSRTTGASVFSGCRPTTATATPSTSRAASSPASTSPGGSCAMSSTGL